MPALYSAIVPPSRVKGAVGDPGIGVLPDVDVSAQDDFKQLAGSGFGGEGGPVSGESHMSRISPVNHLFTMIVRPFGL